MKASNKLDAEIAGILILIIAGLWVSGIVIGFVISLLATLT